MSFNQNTVHNEGNDGQPYKSLSETTVYSPAVGVAGASPKLIKKYKGTEGIVGKNNPNNTVDSDFITEFLKNVRIGAGGSSGASRVRSEVHEVSKDRPSEKCQAERAREDAEERIKKAEAYRAELVPEGNIPISSIFDTNTMQQLKTVIQANVDDEFFHTVCHIDPAIKEKIKLGQFVELEKLLLKPKSTRPRRPNRIDIVSIEGSNKYDLVQSNDQDSKINSVHKWDQAFRVYATIYSKENPTRGPEIWQYIDTIHRAARTFHWESVYEYDYCFRQLMAEYPQRSWARTYTQMWNLTLCEGSIKTQANGNVKVNEQPKQRGWRDGTCWRFNKSRCNYGQNCNFEHRCTYCGSYNHPFQNCPKRGTGGNNGGRHHHKRSEKGKDRSERGGGGQKQEKKRIFPCKLRTNLNCTCFFFYFILLHCCYILEVLTAKNFNLSDVITPVNVPKFEQLLNSAGYNKSKTKFLVDSFKNGIDLGYRGSTQVKQKSNNLKLTIGSETELWNKVMKEVQAQRYAGPFEKIPFEHYIQSPIGLVPKDGGNKNKVDFPFVLPKKYWKIS